MKNLAILKKMREMRDPSLYLETQQQLMGSIPAGDLSSIHLCYPATHKQIQMKKYLPWQRWNCFADPVDSDFVSRWREKKIRVTLKEGSLLEHRRQMFEPQRLLGRLVFQWLICPYLHLHPWQRHQWKGLEIVVDCAQLMAVILVRYVRKNRRPTHPQVTP